jgi:hypothetical protein
MGAEGSGSRSRRRCWVLHSSWLRTRARGTALATTCPAATPGVPTRRPGTDSLSGPPSGIRPAATQRTSCAPTPATRPATCRDACTAFAVASGTGETKTATSTRAGIGASAAASRSVSTGWCRRPSSNAALALTVCGRRTPSASSPSRGLWSPAASAKSLPAALANAEVLATAPCHRSRPRAIATP